MCTEFQLGKKKVLEMNGGENCTMMYMCLVPRIIHVKMANFMLWILYILL